MSNSLDDTDSLAELDQQSLTIAVADLLERHGWQTELPLDLPDSDVDRIATCDGKSYLVRAVPAGAGPVTGSMVTTAAETTDAAGATGFILIAATTVTDVAREQAGTSDRIFLADVETTDGLENTLATVCGFETTADVGSSEGAEPTRSESGATPDMIEVAVEQVTGDDDDDSDDDDDDEETASIERSIPDRSTERADAYDSSGETSGSVRGIDTRIAVGELLLRLVLLFGLLVCGSYLMLRLWQLLL